MDLLIEILLDVYGELIFLIVPKKRTNKKYPDGKRCQAACIPAGYYFLSLSVVSFFFLLCFEIRICFFTEPLNQIDFVRVVRV